MTPLNLWLCSVLLISAGAVSLYVYRRSKTKWLMPAAFLVWVLVGISSARTIYEGDDATFHLSQVNQVESAIPEEAFHIIIIEWNFVKGCFIGFIGCFLSGGVILLINRKPFSTIRPTEPPSSVRLT